jgi:galactokinase
VELIREQRPEVTSLRNATEMMLDEYVKPVNAQIDMRSRYVVQEVNRLLKACEALQQGDIQTVGRLMFETHDGLSRMYGVSCKELDWLVDKVKNNRAVLGARMMGGGFGGCTVNLVHEDQIEPLVESLQPAYEQAMDRPLTYYVASIDNGTEIIR